MRSTKSLHLKGEGSRRGRMLPVVAAAFLLAGCGSSGGENGLAASSSSVAQPPATSTASAALQAVPSGPRADARARIVTDDPHHVDLADLLPQAQRLAQGLRPEVWFEAMEASEPIGGVVDVTKPSVARFDFAYSGLDKSKRPGEDSVAARVSITAGEGELRASVGGDVVTGEIAREGPIALGCTSRQVWAAAVKSGMPENAIVALRYRRNRFVLSGVPNDKGLRPLLRDWSWSLEISGRDDLSRRVDAKTCEVSP